MKQNKPITKGGEALVDLANTLSRTKVKPTKTYKLHELQEDGSVLMLCLPYQQLLKQKGEM